ncbi:MAG: flagellar basal body rod protein FlgB [Rhodobacteraceae bacterium]|nr:flagellar basal body rod protein FlgB [Paracoccaceae bacterium]
MTHEIETMRMAQAMASHAARRQVLVSDNIARADIPGARARDLPAFADSYRLARIGERPTPGAAPGSAAPPPRPVERGGPLSPSGGNVSLEREMFALADVKSQHDMALTVWKKSLDLLRLSLGRNR